MSQLRELKNRTSTITAIKKRVAATKLASAHLWRKACKELHHITCYRALLCDALIYKLMHTPVSYTSAFTVVPTGPPAVVVFGPDKNMCNGFDTNTVHAVNTHETVAPQKTYVFGNRLAQMIPGHHHIGSLTESITCLMRIAHNFLVCNEQIMLRSLEGTTTSLFPLIPHTATARADDTPAYEDLQMHMLPELLIASILHEQCCKVRAHEHLQRMIASEQAVTNCKERLQELEIQQNKYRQQRITTELFEIIGGA